MSGLRFAVVRRRSQVSRMAALTAVGLAATFLLPMPAVASAISGQGRFVPVTPARILDTGSGLGAPRAAVPAHGTVTFAVAGRAGLPSSGATAVALNLTTAAQTAEGFVTAYPAGAARPSTSSANFTPGQATANAVLAKLGTAGEVSVYNGSSGTIRLVADVSGYFTPTASAAAASFVPVTPARILDTGSGLGAPKAAVAAHATMTFSVAGRGGIPASGVTAVALNVTTASQARAGFVTAYPAGATRPSTSSVNFPAGQATANVVLVRLGTAGKVSIYNATSGTIRLVADASGYFTAATSPAASFVPATPYRIFDTGSAPGAGVVPAHGTVTLYVGGHGGLPSSGITAVALNITTAAQAQAGFVTAYPTGSTRPVTSNVNFAAGRATANVVLIALGTANNLGNVTVYNGSSGAIRLVADVSGYFTTQPAWTAAAVYETVPSALTCSTATTCTSVGNVNSPDGWRPAAMTLTDGTVTQTTELPGLDGGDYSYLMNGVSCPSSDVCTAVGEARDSSSASDPQSSLLTEQLAAGRWTRTVLPVPSGYKYGSLDSVSCVDASHCVAAGSMGNHNLGPYSNYPLVEVYRNGTWTPASIPVPATTLSARLGGVSCVGPNTCHAVGSAYLGSGKSVPIVETYDGATWTLTTAQLPDGTASTGYFSAISCSTATACTAVGGGGATAMASIYTGADWVTLPVAAAPGHQGSALNSVSCTAPGSCTAAGSDSDAESYDAPLPLVQTLTGTTWTASNPPLPLTGTDNGSLNAISCFSASNCTAVGAPDDLPYALIETR